jgi:Immunity protein 50
VVFRLDLPRYPTEPPRKWAAQGFNTVEIELNLFSIRELSIEGWSYEPVADIALERDGNTVLLTTSTSAIRCRVRTLGAHVTHISAYLNAGPDASC